MPAGRSSANPKQAEQLRAGKTSLLGFFVGQVMKETKGAANPQLVNDAAEEAPRARLSAWPPSRRLPAGVARRRARVLIVDDNVELVGTLHAVLMSAELSDGRAASNAIEVVTASRGDEGLAIARAQRLRRRHRRREAPRRERRRPHRPAPRGVARSARSCSSRASRRWTRRSARSARARSRSSRSRSGPRSSSRRSSRRSRRCASRASARSSSAATAPWSS